MNNPTNKQPSIATFNNKPISLSLDAVRQVFDTNGLPAIISAVLAIILSVATQAFSGVNQTDATSGLLQFGFFGLSAFVGVIGTGIAIKSIAGEKMTFSEAVSWSLEKFLVYLGYVLALIALIVGGLLLLVIPGVLFAIWFGLAPILKLDEGGTLRENFAKSKSLIRGREVEYLAVGIAGFIVSGLSLLGPAAQTAPTIAWLRQVQSAKAKNEEMPKTATQSWVLVSIAVVMSAIIAATFIFLIAASA